jgi:Fe-S cluster assembly protein SufD
MARASLERWTEAFDAFTANGASGAPGWLRTLRDGAMQRFSARGFPRANEEAYRFTSTSDLEQTIFHAAQGAVVTADQLAASRLLPDVPCAVTVNGRFDAATSTLQQLPAGVTVMSLAQATLQYADLVQPYLDTLSGAADSPFAALATAFLRDGVFVHVAKDVVIDRPIEIVHVTVPDATPIVSHPRMLVVVELGAQAGVVETYAGTTDAPYWVNAVSEYAVGENARLETHRIQREGAGAWHTGAVHSSQGRSSHHQILSFAFGGQLTRIDAGAVLDGEGAECTLNGLIVAQGRQHVDHHTTLDHAKPHCNSWEFFNGIYDDEARGVFTGRIIVRPGAQKTDSKQTSNNLLLSDTARADSQPQLEIYADDVRCTHGATLGPIDERHLFYMQSRGLSRTEARNLLTWGFGAEILNYVVDDELRAALDAIVHARLDAGAQRRGER